jgi:hypothetical protein
MSFSEGSTTTPNLCVVNSLASRLAGERMYCGWGKRGSFALRLHSRRGARWYDFEAQTGGDMLALIMEQMGIDFAEAVRWARGWTGDDPSVRSTRPRPREKAADFDDQQAAKRRQAVDLWAAGRPIEDTPGARYLCEHRGITFWNEKSRLRPRGPQWQ